MSTHQNGVQGGNAFISLSASVHASAAIGVNQAAQVLNLRVKTPPLALGSHLRPQTGHETQHALSPSLPTVCHLQAGRRADDAERRDAESHTTLRRQSHTNLAVTRISALHPPPAVGVVFFSSFRSGQSCCLFLKIRTQARARAKMCPPVRCSGARPGNALREAPAYPRSSQRARLLLFSAPLLAGRVQSPRVAPRLDVRTWARACASAPPRNRNL